MFEIPNVLYATSTKSDGNLSIRLESLEIILPRREAFLAKHGLRSEDCVFMDTEHEDKIVHVGVADKGTSISAEAFITTEKGVVLYLLTADCFPVTFYDATKHILALAHMGWKPTDKLLATKVIEEMKRAYDSNPEEIHVFIGPGIHKDSYVFTDPVQRQLPSWTPFLIELPSGEIQIDILRYIKGQATMSGVPDENIHISQIDTATSEEYFSHYRSARSGEPEGRFATVVALL